MQRQHVDIMALIQWYEPYSIVLAAENARVRTRAALINYAHLQVRR